MYNGNKGLFYSSLATDHFSLKNTTMTQFILEVWDGLASPTSLTPYRTASTESIVSGWKCNPSFKERDGVTEDGIPSSSPRKNTNTTQKKALTATYTIIQNNQSPNSSMHQRESDTERVQTPGISHSKQHAVDKKGRKQFGMEKMEQRIKNDREVVWHTAISYAQIIHLNTRWWHLV